MTLNEVLLAQQRELVMLQERLTERRTLQADIEKLDRQAEGKSEERVTGRRTGRMEGVRGLVAWVQLLSVLLSVFPFLLPVLPCLLLGDAPNIPITLNTWTTPTLLQRPMLPLPVP